MPTAPPPSTPVAKLHSRAVCYTILQLGYLLCQCLSHPTHHPRIGPPEPLPTSGPSQITGLQASEGWPTLSHNLLPIRPTAVTTVTLWTSSHRSTCSGSRFSLGENLYHSPFIARSVWLSKLSHKNASQQLCPPLSLLHLIGFVLSGHSGLSSLSPPWQQASAPVSKAVFSLWSSPHFSISFFLAWSKALCFVLTNTFPWQRLSNIEYTSQHLLQFNNEWRFFFFLNTKINLSCNKHSLLWLVGKGLSNLFKTALCHLWGGIPCTL